MSCDIHGAPCCVGPVLWPIARVASKHPGATVCVDARYSDHHYSLERSMAEWHRCPASAHHEVQMDT